MLQISRMKTRRSGGNSNIPDKTELSPVSFNVIQKVLNQEKSLHFLELRVQTLESIVRNLLGDNTLSTSKKRNLTHMLNAFSTMKPIYGGKTRKHRR
jgi:hypothetical protein